MSRRLFLALPGDPGPGPETGTDARCLRTLPVPPDLSGIVGQALLYHEVLPAGAVVDEFVLPDGALRIAIDLTRRAHAPLALGPRSTAQNVTLAGTMRGLSLTIRAGAARTLLGLPLAEIRGLDVPLADLGWSHDLEGFLPLSEARTESDLAEALWESLRNRLARVGAAPLPRTLTMLLATDVTADVPERKRVVSERRRQQLFRDHVGLTPATTARLHRWHCLLRTLRTTPRPDWAALAVAHGWFDQSHMVRDFRTFSGLSPTEYFRSMISPLSNTEGHIVR